MSLIKSPLRYPGGKSKALAKILENLPLGFNEEWEYREPFVGGGSLFIYLAQTYPNLKIWINDLNPEVYAFWFAVKNNPSELLRLINSLKDDYKNNGRELKDYLISTSNKDLIFRGARFFILNRITFSGTIESGGYSESAFRDRFTESSILRLKLLDGLMGNIKVTNLNYAPLLKYSERVFMYLDPPYLSAKNLYGKNGSLHNNFNHVKLRDYLSVCKNNFLMTYDDSLEIRELYKDFNIKEFYLTYSMRQGKGRELFIKKRDIA